MRRACFSLLQSYLKIFPCVILIGVRQCGKTTLLKTLPQSWKHFDMERWADHEVISRNPDTFFRLNPQQVTIDEAQISPNIFPALRVAIDDHRDQKGRFVIRNIPRVFCETAACCMPCCAFQTATRC